MVGNTPLFESLFPALQIGKLLILDISFSNSHLGSVRGTAGERTGYLPLKRRAQNR